MPMRLNENPCQLPEIVSFKHGYKLDGKYVPRVTTILSVIAKPALLVWARREALKLVRSGLEPHVGKSVEMTQAFIDELITKADKEPDRIKDEAANVGTRAHKAIDQIIRGEKPELTTDIIPCVESFMEWKKQSGLELLPGEIKVASKIHGYAGTLDGIARRGKNLVLTDWKTSNGIWPEYAYQVAAYAEAYTEISNEEIEEAWIIRFPKKLKDGEAPFEAKKINNLVGALNVFLAAKRIYDNAKTDWFV